MSEEQQQADYEAMNGLGQLMHDIAQRVEVELNTDEANPNAAHTIETQFGTYDVHPDTWVPPNRNFDASNDITVSEFEELQQAWNRIQDGVGMDIDSTSAGAAAQQQDLEQFDTMLRNGLETSSSFREMIIEIAETGADDPSKDIAVHLGHDNAIADRFDNGAVDLDDLDRLPQLPTRQDREAFTETENLAHILAERRADMADGVQGDDFDPNHAAGIRAQNEVRDELRQTRIADHVGIDDDGDGDPDRAEFRAADGRVLDRWDIGGASGNEITPR